MVVDDGGAALARDVKCAVDAWSQERSMSRSVERLSVSQTSVWNGGCNERYAGDEHDASEPGKRRLEAES